MNELVDLLTIEIDKEPSPGRQRKKTAILSACTPFIELDYMVDYLNPTVRMAHKTVGEFLSQDPSTLDFVDQDCYKFFVKWKEGNLEFGQRCLSYLSYKRYSNPEDLTVLANFQGITHEHPFLIYAALFWHQHLDRHGGSEELFKRVRDFLRSPNIWTCIRVQSKYAPHLFARLSYDCKIDSFKMHSPDTPCVEDDPEHEYYADALPTWIDKYDNMGDNLVWGYHMFVREWAEVLIRRPEYVQCYFAKALGRRSFWSTNQCSTDAVQIYPLEDFGLFRQMMLFKPEGYAGKKVSKCWFELIPTGLKASFGILNEIPKSPIIVLEDWQIDLQSDPCHEASLKLTCLDHVHLLQINTPATDTPNQLPSRPPTPACLNMNVDNGAEEGKPNEKPADGLPLWVVETGHPGLLDDRTLPDGNVVQSCKVDREQSLSTVSKILIADILEQRRSSVYERTGERGHASKEMKFPTTLDNIQTLLDAFNRGDIFGYHKKQSVIDGELKVTSYRFRGYKNGPESTLEDSDEDSDTESGEEVVREDVALRILSVVKGNSEAHWYWHVSNDFIRNDPLPVFDKNKACLLWPQARSSLLVVDVATLKTNSIELPNQKYKKHRLMTQCKNSKAPFHSSITN